MHMVDYKKISEIIGDIFSVFHYFLSREYSTQHFSHHLARVTRNKNILKPGLMFTTYVDIILHGQRFFMLSSDLFVQ